MEEKGLSFTKQNIKNPEIIDRSVIGSDITINKEKYVLWELEQVLRQPFSKWWKRHKYVFGSFKVQKLDNFQYEVMVLNYNIMVRYLNEESPFDIFISEYIPTEHYPWYDSDTFVCIVDFMFYLLSGGMACAKI